MNWKNVGLIIGSLVVIIVILFFAMDNSEPETTTELSEEDKYLEFSLDVICSTANVYNNTDANEDAGFEIYMILIAKMKEYGYTNEDMEYLGEKYGDTSSVPLEDLLEERCPGAADIMAQVDSSR